MVGTCIISLEYKAIGNGGNYLNSDREKLFSEET